MDTDVEPERGRTISSATHSIWFMQVAGVDFILKTVGGPAIVSSTSVLVELQYTLHL